MSLGWDVWVTREPSFYSETLVSWEAHPGLLTTMETLVAQGDALVVSSSGGYPDVFELRMEIIRNWVTDADPLMQRKSYGFGFENWELIDELPDNEPVYLTMMDES